MPLQQLLLKITLIDLKKNISRFHDNPLALILTPLISLSIFLGILWRLDLKSNGGVLTPKESLTLTTTLTEGEAAFLESEARDAKRISDISQLMAGLKAYQIENEKYPQELQELAPKYLRALPKDPISKKDYQYRYADTTYSITYLLEAGTRLGNQAIAAGTHIATPERISQYMPDLPEDYLNSCQ